MTTDTGGPAFPSGTDFYGGSNKEYGKRGLTLRDYFAAKVMQGLISSIRAGETWSNSEIARLAYMTAEAMLKERNK